MTKIFFSLLCLFSQTIFCQNTFTKFITKSSVQWAADVTEPFHFNAPNLSLLLRERFDKGAIKVGITEGLANTRIKKNTSIESVLNRIAPNRVQQIAGERNVTGTTFEAENPLFSPSYFDSLVNDLVEIPQILYIQSGQLKSFIPWVSPKYAVSTSWGQRLGIANAFSTAFNTCRRISSRQKRNAVLVGSSSTLIQPDSTLQPKMLKQLYAQSLLQALWPSLNTNNYQIIRIDSLSIVPFEKINMSLLDDAISNVPIYDAEGKLSNETVTATAQPLEALAFTKVQLVQDWFYYAKDNILFSRLQHLILYAHKYKNGRAEAQAVPVLKIMLN